ncbi:hypothetical protein POKO110462_02220 [Pontibacter korlensis]|uniref:Uncharacterized protein n=1 Tax=Pontibacter korlensis TaxID=400092 RepID=A0A0E3UWV5_9BACT|nr:hypothetical protein [Pontibacter korlensis]AKD03707.1 hypothetical protein PKOR_11945 [Pontibacter korlensis]
MKEDKLNELERMALEAAHKYWKEYMYQNGKQDNMLTWVRNEDTGEMLCLTKGGYTNRLSEFVNGLD